MTTWTEAKVILKWSIPFTMGWVFCSLQAPDRSPFPRYPMPIFEQKLESPSKPDSPSNAMQAPAAAGADDCDLRKFPWAKSAEAMKHAIADNNPFTDKTTSHEYQFMYHQYLSKLVQRKCFSQDRTIKILEIGLGCGMASTGASKGAGGGVTFYRNVISAPLRLEMHVLEYAKDCAVEWANENPGKAHVHTGSQASKEDLDRMLAEAGPGKFDLIVDDASHVNDHMSFTLQYLISRVKPGGFYIVEDTHGSCFHWGANSPDSVATGGTADPFAWYSKGEGNPDCMVQKNGSPTFYALVVEWQKRLLLHTVPKELPGVHHIDHYMEAVVFEVAE